MKFVKKVWGSEKWIVNNDLYCGKVLTLKKMFRCSIHHHKKKTETFYVSKGQVLLEVDDNAYMMLPGDAVDVLVGQNHRFTGLEDSEIFEFSTHHEDEDSYRKIASGEVGTGDIEALNRKIYLTRDNNEVIRRINDGKNNNF
jgi:mannose-6-phosphate isomerase-like protein (cupin superfamily)